MIKVSHPSRRRFVGRVCAMLPSFGAWRSCLADDEERFRAIFPLRVQHAVEQGLHYLAQQQNRDGSFGSSGAKNARNVGVCGLCGMAMLAHGSSPGRGPFGAEIVAATKFVLASSQQGGFIADRTSQSPGPMYGHGFATLFLADVYGMSPEADLREKLASAVQLIVRTQNEAGGWRYEPRRGEADISVTVCQVMALRAARNAGFFVPNETMDRATAYIRRCQNADGGFRYMDDRRRRSEFPRSAAAVVALFGAGLYDSREVALGLDYVRKQLPDSRTFARQNYFIYGHYYAAQAMWHSGGEDWARWYPTVRDLLLARQQPDGAWFDSEGFEYGTAMSCLILQMPRNYLPIFRR